MSGRIIGILKEAEGFVSGAKISGELGLTRAAVWKRIRSLREKGFIIEASSGKGYRLLSAPEFSVEELQALLKGRFGKEIIFLKKTASTNDLAMELAQNHAPEGTVVIADSQTNGRGRLGRRWSSPQGVNIYMSVILRPEIAPKDATLLTIMSAVSVAEAVKKTTGLDVTIKWPNDLIVSGRKLGGILLEMRSEPDRILFAVVGVGINVNIRSSAFPPDIRDIATSVLEETGDQAKRTTIAAEILTGMENNLNLLKQGKISLLLQMWRGLSSTLGRDVIVTTGDITIRGTAEDIDREGRLILSTADGPLKISAGDLTVLR
ncbi:MAG: biotin--[acetyl-CoA-carboxylase] ligase [Thermodesulfovibrionales bacterium]|nr:biotin--[acetyl-CoA-carboxylase] ligase [Thermodesulfovibrionales bacterium]